MESVYPTIPSSLSATIQRPRRQPPLALYRAPYQKIVSAGLYHETTHIAGLFLDDVEFDRGRGTEVAYGWSNIRELNTLQRLTNADSYLFLGLLARYESLGLLLDTFEARAELGVLMRAPAGWVPP